MQFKDKRQDLRDGLVQSLRPLSSSIEWQLGQQFLKASGAEAFLPGESSVPFVVNNDGQLSKRAAAVFFESCVRNQQLHVTELITCLEIGPGVGLFAKFFLDDFRRRCHEAGVDFYDRTIYILADYSSRMLMDIQRRGVLAGHEGRYRLQVIDAQVIDEGLDLIGVQEMHGVFLNYLLDCLPVSVVRRRQGVVEQLCVRARLAHNTILRDFSPRSIEQLRLLAEDGSETDILELSDIADVLVAEFQFDSKEIDAIPDLDLNGVVEGQSQVNSFGALALLRRLGSRLHEHGCMIVNDYGTEFEDSGQDFEHQRYSGATFVGVHFQTLGKQLEDSSELAMIAPVKGVPSLHSRLIVKKHCSELQQEFDCQFGLDASEEDRKKHQIAVQAMQHQRHEVALAAFEVASAAQPYNWILLSEASRFLLAEMDNAELAIDVAIEGLKLNPGGDAELWTTLADALMVVGRKTDARYALAKAEAINPSDPRSRFCLAKLEFFDKRFDEALRCVGEAMIRDTRGALLKGLLQLQQDILQALAHQSQLRHRRRMNRVRNLDRGFVEKVPVAEVGT